MSAMMDLWISGVRDKFGYRFRDAWHVRGWEEGRVPEGYVCWLARNPEPKLIEAVKPAASQMDLFSELPA